MPLAGPDSKAGWSREWDANKEARLVTTQLMGDAPRIESTPFPHNVPHARAHSHTPAALGAPDEEDEDL
jgi:hypothetical protein